MSEVLDLNLLENGAEIETKLAIKDKKAVRPYKDGNFFTLLLGNKSGEVQAKYWGGGRSEVQELHDRLSIGDVVQVVGRVEEYRGRTQISLDSDQGEVIKLVDPEVYDSSDYLPEIEEDPEHLFSAISKRVRNLENRHLYELCMRFYGSREFAPKLKEMPAAKSYHHNKIGGFIKHVHDTMALAETFCDRYPDLDRELLLAGVFLHDIGKIQEYEYGAAIDFTDEGRLLGHIPIGDHMVTNAIEEIEDFPEDLALKVRHMVLSHHGRKEWGSAVEPRTVEAIVLHELEYLDSKVSKTVETFRKHRASEDRGVYDSSLGKYLYLK